MRSVYCAACAFAALAPLTSAATLGAVAPNGEAQPGSELFEEFVAEHKRPYQVGSPEFKQRQSLFHQRLSEVDAINNRPERLWTAAINHFADRTDDELKAYRGWKRTGLEPKQALTSFLEVERRKFPEAFNWLNLTRAYAIPEQGSCGSCWAVTTAAVMDAHREIWGKKVQSFSAQELVSCVANPQKCGGSGGCDGATVELGMKWIQEKGLSLESEVPYKARDTACSKTALVRTKDAHGGQSGGKQTSGLGLGMTGYETLPSNKEAPLLAALIDKGPVAISVAAGSWFSYSSGIFNDCAKDCVVDHAVTLYGIGKDGANKYWLIRNSWGPSWGERGFIRMKRTDNEEGVCGTDNNPQEGVGCAGGPPSVTVCGTCGMLYDSVIPHMKPGMLIEVDDSAGRAEQRFAGIEDHRLFRREQRTDAD